MSPLRFPKLFWGGSMGVILIFIVLYASFILGAASGANAAINESSDPLPVIHEDVKGVQAEVDKSIEQNASAAGQIAYNYMGLRGVTALTIASTHSGINFGYSNSTLVERLLPYAHIPIYIMFGILVLVPARAARQMLSGVA